MVTSTQPLPAVPSPRPVQTLHRLRWPLFAAYAATLAGIVTWFLLSGDGYFDDSWILITICLGTFLALQATFLLGMPHLRWPNPTPPVPMMVSLATGALLAALLTFGVAASLLNIGSLWEKVTGAVEAHVFWFIAAAWAAWFFVFAVMWAGEWLLIFRRIYRLLIAGTCLELLITIPIDAHVRRRTSCYCGEGTFFAMVIGMSLALWSFGPGLALLFLTRRLQLKGYYALCRHCTYDLRGLTPDIRHCPECGTRIPERHRAAIQSR
jgi:hypothetical protein